MIAIRGVRAGGDREQRRGASWGIQTAVFAGKWNGMTDATTSRTHRSGAFASGRGHSIHVEQAA